MRRKHILILVFCGVIAGVWRLRLNSKPNAEPVVKGSHSYDLSAQREFIPESDTADIPGFYIDDEDGTASRMTLMEIRQRHQELLMMPLPDYAKELRGIHSTDRQDMGVNGWYFTMEKDKISNFQQYLKALGVPSEALQAKMRVPFQMVPAPTPPVNKLRFISSTPAMADCNAKGMFFDKASTVVYYLRNDNEQRTIDIYFSHATGNTMVVEVRPEIPKP